MTRPAPSLQRRLVWRLLAFQAAVLLLFAAAFVSVVVDADAGGKVVGGDLAEVAARAIRRDASGRLSVEQTRELTELQRIAPDLWFIARSDDGREVRLGSPPPVYVSLSRRLDRIAFGDLRDADAPYTLSAIVRRVSGPAGEFTVLGRGRMYGLTFVVLLLSNLLILPILLLLAVILLTATPWIVRRSLAGLETTAREAALIDVDRRGRRLSPSRVPEEVAPLVKAMNGALQRLDEGYDRHHRFILDAAHELRTPIAILQLRAEGMPSSAAVDRLRLDIQRLATLSEQLLDVQRVDSSLSFSDNIDLGLCARRVAANLAPILIASGCETEVEDLGSSPVRGDAAAIERVLTNLVQNAVEHGGSRVTMRVEGTTIEVEDNGPGIPLEDRERIFEPFHRLRARSTGAGLGLSLVRRIVDLHAGTIEVMSAADGGAVIRIEFATP